MKKNLPKLIQLAIITSVLFSITSCSLHIEKRRYRKGYHVDLSYHQPAKTQSVDPVSLTSQDPIPVNPSTTQPTKSTGLKDSLVEIATKPVETKKRVTPSKKTSPVVKPQQKRGDNCDIITFMDGHQEEIIVEEITETEVKYKKCNFREGPSYKTSKANIKRIDMYNGEVFIPEIKGSATGKITGTTTASLVLGILALIFLIIGAVLTFSVGWLAALALAPAGILSLIGVIMGATQLRKGAHKVAWIAFFLNLFVQIMAIVFTVIMFGY